MQEYKREYPLFSLCGLNCGLCPRFYTEGDSRCPGCGGPLFHLKHPACAVITCNRKHNNVEFCFQCSDYPCARYGDMQPVDSFISYRNVLADLGDARKNLAQYKRNLQEKISILRTLIERYNDGKRKSHYCLAVSLLTVRELRSILRRAATQSECRAKSLKEKAALTGSLLDAAAAKRGIQLRLRR